MKLFTADQIRAWDAYTILHEPIASADLMERAGRLCAEWLLLSCAPAPFRIVCGTGNNGGDGLVIARHLSEAGRDVTVIVCGDPTAASADFRVHFAGLPASVRERLVQWNAALPLPDLRPGEWIIDALLGTGIRGPVQDEKAALIDHMNASGASIIAIDLPSGLQPDLMDAQGGSIVRASHTLTFMIPKRAFLLEENATYTGEYHVLDIHLHPDFQEQEASDWVMPSPADIAALLPVRPRFGHKHDFGHLQVVAGSYGMMGAAVLCTRAALRTGCGLVTAHVPACGVAILQTAVPEAMCRADEGMNSLASATLIERANAVAIGPGIGQHPETSLMLRRMLSETDVPMVIDADALNIIGKKELLKKIPSRSILTPHAGEFDRLFGHHDHHGARIRTQQQKSEELGITIVLKGAFTSISGPSGSVSINSTGNPCMATAGSGDVLTGVIGSLLAQGMDPFDAAVAGVFLHGTAGDRAVERLGPRGIIAGDIVEILPTAYSVLMD